MQTPTLQNYLFLILLFFSGFLYTQNATVRGVLLDAENNPIANATISYENGGTISDFNGYYSLEIPSQQAITLTVAHISHQNITLTLTLSPNEDFEWNPLLNNAVAQIGTVVLDAKKRKQIKGIVSISPEAIRKIPGANAGVENLLKSLPGVNSNNELSTQYAVRGGNYDENLVYVNEVEVYRPFLIRSGQQEGLSFVNSDLTAKVDFSAGGFQAKYGDKLSSVLDITYRRPVKFDASADFSMLGASISAGGKSNDGRFTALTGLRYRDNSLFVDAKQTETNFRPRFFDAQTWLAYKVSNKFELGFLGNFSSNRYDYTPLTRQTNFGTISDPVALLVFYEGQEKDKYTTLFGALKGTYVVSDNFTAKFIASAYHTQEEEFFDILAQYRLGEVNTDIGSENLGEVEFSEGIGSQLTHARNQLDALIINFEHKGTASLKDHTLEYGIKYTDK
mgnify:CR=1 FL=1